MAFFQFFANRDAICEAPFSHHVNCGIFKFRIFAMRECRLTRSGNFFLSCWFQVSLAGKLAGWFVCRFQITFPQKNFQGPHFKKIATHIFEYMHAQGCGSPNQGFSWQQGHHIPREGASQLVRSQSAAFLPGAHGSSAF